MIFPLLPDLPVAEILPTLLGALETGRSAVLVAPPGAGKTTLVPPSLLRASWRGEGTILLLEPRRLAARAAARRMAGFFGEEPGGIVGYAMRMERRITRDTRILVVTEGILARMILDDPELTGIAAILFDEFHERSLDGDFGLALALDVQSALRPDLRLVVMSATIDGSRVAHLFGEAPVIKSSGRSFAVEIRHRERAAGVPIEDAMAAAIRDALAQEPGSVLAFLPGQREIERTAERLAGRIAADVDIAPLYGMLDGQAQDAAINPAIPGRRKVVLATSIAETSLTIDGVRVVIDSGLSRLPRYEPSSGLTRLETVRVSRASADQRAGRAGRTGPGVAIRLWRVEQTGALAPYTPPEILDADLSSLLLDCAAFGVADPSSLRFLDPPPRPALKEAAALLTSLGAIDADGRLTVTGKAMRALALPVRLAHMVAAAPDPHGAAMLAILLTERGLGGDGVDLDRRLLRLRSERSPRAVAAKRLAERLAKSAASRSAFELAVPAPHPPAGTFSPYSGGEKGAASTPTPSSPRSSRREGMGEGRREVQGKVATLSATPASAGALLLHAWPDRVAKARGERGRFLLANGAGAMLDPADPLAGEAFLVVADLQGKAQSARIASAAAVTEADIRATLTDRLERRRFSDFDVGRGAVRVRETVSLGAIVLSEAMLPPPVGAEADRAMIEAVRAHGLQLLPWSKSAEALRQRLGWLNSTLGPPWPDMSEKTLLSSLDAWLLPFLPGHAAIARIDPGAIEAGLMSLVPHDLQRRIDALAPTHFHAPSASSVPIRYEEGGPVLAIRVQELFGLERHPTVGDGKTALTLELLSPAHRPIQTTRDLPGFWRGSWAEVRAEMRGRYPRHVWPEDPATAVANSRAKPRVK